MTTARLNGFYAPEFVPEGRRHFPVGSLARGMAPEGYEVEIGDARALQTAEGTSEADFFARHSFVLLPHVTAVRDWDRDCEALYLPEIEQVIRDRLFPGRRVEVQQGPHVLRRGRDTPNPGYGDGVHSDGGLDLGDYLHNIRAFAGEQAAHWWRALYEHPDVLGLVWIDFWRTTNMAAALEHMPLALCDPGTLDADDIVPVAMTGIAPDGRESHHLSLRFRPGQRWYYYPSMTSDELLAFKLAEFWKGPAPVRNCFHSAFDDPAARADAEKRQSCEHRVAVLVLAD
jgi:hypothetical protein